MQTNAQGFIGCLKVTIRQPNIGVLFVEGLLTTLLAFPFALTLANAKQTQNQDNQDEGISKYYQVEIVFH